MALTGPLADLPDLTEIADYDDAAHALPWRGYHVGSGPHAPISDTPGGSGWTLHRHRPQITGADAVELKTDPSMKNQTAAYVQAIIDSTPPGAERGRLISLLAKLSGASPDLLSVREAPKEATAAEAFTKP